MENEQSKKNSYERDKYTIMIEVDQNMTPLQNRNSLKINHVDENKRRTKRAKHVDLWAKGDLFPIDPITNSHPNFKSVTRLVKLLCNGSKWLLGYCENIKGNSKHFEEKVNNLLNTISYLKYINYKLVESINQIQNMNEFACK